MRIYNNVPALGARNALAKTESEIQKSIRKLSSGLRINSAADDAAGLAISEKMRAQIKGLDMASRNAQDGISMMQTAQGALQETTSILQRMRELAVQSANDTLTQQDRCYIQLEIEQLKSELDRIASTTQFNKKRLLDGSSDVLWSASDIGIHAVVRSGILKEDEGNFKISMQTLKTGEAEIKKSNIFEARIEPGAIEGRVIGMGYSEQRITMTLTHNERNISPGITGVPAGANHTNGVGTFQGVTTATGTNPNGYYDGAGTCGHVFMYGSPVGNARAGTYVYDFPPPPGTAGAYYEDYNYPTIRKVAAFGMDVNDIHVADDFDSIIKMFGGDPDTFNPATSTLFNDIPNTNIIFEVLAIHDVEETVTFKVTSRRFDKFTNQLPDIESFITIGKRGISGGVMGGGVVTVHGEGAYSVGAFDALGINILPNSIKLNKDFDKFSVGDSFHLNITPPIGQPSSANNYPSVPLRITYNGDYELYYVFDKSFQTGHLDIPYLMIDTNNGDIYNANLRSYFNGLPFPHGNPVSLYRQFTVGVSTLPDITNQQMNIDVTMEVVYNFQTVYKTLGETFTNAITFPQVLTLHQGESSATVVLYENDTFYDIANKLNYAIAFGLDNAKYVKDSISNFAVMSDGTAGTSEAVGEFGPSRESEYIWAHFSTIVIRSAIPGQDGIIHFSGDEELLKIMGFNVIQEAEESIFNMYVSDAHDGTSIASNVKVAGNCAVGIVNKNIDLYFDPMKNMEVFWNEAAKRFDFRGKSAEEVLHVAYNATVLQVGANEKEELMIAFADAGSRALGLSNILLLNNKLSERAITKIDTAIDRVSSMRSSLGAYTNRLLHTISNLTVAHENLTSSESRIRDLDMAKELMRLAKLSILVNSGNSMLTQANQLPQGILSLIK